MLLLPVPPGAEAQIVRQLGEVRVDGFRPLSQSGIVKSSLDSAALKDNIALSMADVLATNTPLFVKSAGRASISTVSFRGTAASHTAVTWNGLDINSPSLGMTDFSLIPAYMVDNASLYYGSSSLSETTGGLGGAISLTSDTRNIPDGLTLQYIQGVGSFDTFDEFAAISYGGPRVKSSTKVAYSSSRNDFKFVNRDKYENVYDDNHQIVDRYHPTERNRNGAFRDFHLFQSLSYDVGAGNVIDLNAWYLHSNRQLPLPTVDYTVNRRFINLQRENTLRSVLSWQHRSASWHSQLTVAYSHTHLDYDYAIDPGNGIMNSLTRSRTNTNRWMLKVNTGWTPVEGLYLTADAHVSYDRVLTVDRASLNGSVGYDRGRASESLNLAAHWRLLRRFTASAIVRQDLSGGDYAVTPALFFEYVPAVSLPMTVKASVSRNHHFPSLNDLYFQPGGNPDLKSEKGFSYDGGISVESVSVGPVNLQGSLSIYGLHISDWILWLPTTKGFFSPRNMQRVRSCGGELTAGAAVEPFRDAVVRLKGSYALTASVNDSDPLGDSDHSVGKQLPYIPRHSAFATLTLQWRSWGLTYKWSYYSRRYTMSSNENVPNGSLPHYYMSDIALEKNFYPSFANLNLKLSVNNLFDASYQTIRTRPMPGLNFEIFLAITPKF